MSTDKPDIRDELDRIDDNINGLYEGLIPDLKNRLDEIEKRQREIETEIEQLRNLVAEMEGEE